MWRRGCCVLPMRRHSCLFYTCLKSIICHWLAFLSCEHSIHTTKSKKMKYTPYFRLTLHKPMKRSIFVRFFSLLFVAPVRKQHLPKKKHIKKDFRTHRHCCCCCCCWLFNFQVCLSSIGWLHHQQYLAGSNNVKHKEMPLSLCLKIANHPFELIV